MRCQSQSTIRTHEACVMEAEVFDPHVKMYLCPPCAEEFRILELMSASHERDMQAQGLDPDNPEGIAQWQPSTDFRVRQKLLLGALHARTN